MPKSKPAKGRRKLTARQLARLRATPREIVRGMHESVHVLGELLEHFDGVPPPEIHGASVTFAAVAVGHALLRLAAHPDFAAYRDVGLCNPSVNQTMRDAVLADMPHSTPAQRVSMQRLIDDLASKLAPPRAAPPKHLRPNKRRAKPRAKPPATPATPAAAPRTAPR